MVSSDDLPEPTVVEEWARVGIEEAAAPLPPATRERVKAAVLDFAGVGVAGAASEAPRVLASLAPVADGEAAATQIGYRTQSLPAAAACTNSAAGHALDLDDGSRFAAGHPGTIVIPAALAAAETSDCDGPRMLRAIALGYEVFIVLAEAVNPAHLRRGFHTTATVGPLAAAMAAGVARGDDARTVARSLSLAGLMGAGLMEVTLDGAAAKPLQVGRAAGAGVFAALLAERGLSGPRRVIEGESGFLEAMAGGRRPDLDLAICSGALAIERVYVKRYACCRHTHAALDAAIELRRRHAAEAGTSIARVVVGTYEAAARICGEPVDPKTPEDARFSLPFSVAVAIALGDAGPTAFSMSSLGHPKVRDLARRVTVEVDSRLEALYPERRGATLEIVMADGRVEHTEVLVPKGEPENPFTRAELIDKFRATTALGGLAAQRADVLLRRIEDLDQLDRAADVLEPLRAWAV